MSFQPGMSTDRELAKVWYAEALEQAARDRADRQANALDPGAAARQILLAASVAVVVLAVWLVVF